MLALLLISRKIESQLLWLVPPTNALLQTMYTLSWKQYSLMAVASFSRIIHRATKQKCFRNGLRGTTMSWRCRLDLQIPQISVQSSICGTCWTNKSDPWRPHLATYRTADIVVPDTPTHLQGSSGVHASMGQGCFGSKRGTNTILGRWT